MLVVPIEGKISWRNPPIVTLVIIMLNCILLFGFQAGDMERQYAVYEEYYESGLMDLETERYAQWLEARGDHIRLQDFDLVMEEGDLSYVFWFLLSDGEFMGQLLSDQVILAGDPEYSSWKEDREYLDTLLSKVISWEYGFIPAKPRPVTFFSYMFLHGDAGHLIGNMIFFWIVGCLLEMGLGRIAYTLAYIGLGAFSAAVFWVANMESFIPLVGASGAIAGLMGAVTALYGKTRINVFVSVGFYFKYLKIPALVLLPVWVGKEFYYMASLGDESNVAFMAHAGGLLGGALAGITYRQIMGKKSQEFFAEEEEDLTPGLLDEAKAAIRNVDFAQARPPLQKILEKDPNHMEALKLLFSVEKMAPESKEFHKVASRLFTLFARDELSLWETYQEYTRSATKISIPPAQHLQLAKTFAKAGRLKPAEKIIGAYFKQRPDTPELPAALYVLGQSYEKRNMPDKAKNYFTILRKKYPQSQEAGLVQH